MWVVWLSVLVLAASTSADDVETFAVAGEYPCNGDNNATMVACPYPCPRTCNNLKSLQSCTKACPEFGCQCNPGYVLSPLGKCILRRDCPAKCPRNAVYKRCPSPCQPTCDNPSGPASCAGACVEYGCECKSGYVLTPKGKCIHLNKCPAARYCSRNETYSACRIDCPSEFCPVTDDRAKVGCALFYPCPPGCVCKANHLRLSPDDDRCILASDCPPVKCKRPNEVWNSCPPNCFSESCDDIGRNQTRCPQPQYCDPRCVCKPGFYRNDKDICVPAAECRKCPPNAVYKKCPSACPGTCENPSGDRPCTRACREYGCECKPGYVVSDGKCISVNECPAAKFCSKNETFAPCKVNCPTEFCPVNDGRAKIACAVAFPCPQGCVCKANYSRLSSDNDKCILSSECPPVKCKRPNEVWNSCPSNCLADRCDDIGRNQTRCPQPQYCDPQCVCKPGFFRNDSDICISAAECRKCPPNAVYKKCPSPCPGTCENPSGDWPCTRACREYGCECKPGYVMSDGKCISLNECPAAKSCTKNETFAACKINCPSEYCPVNDDRARIACSVAYPCPSGCICKANHSRLSPDNDKCILSSECPPVKCKRPNEVWNSCPPNCLSERCDDIGRNQTRCPEPHYCAPQCVCKPGFYRNDSDICVPAAECSKCPPNAVYKKSPSPCPGTCEYPGGESPCSVAGLEYGCECKPGYVLSNGECISLKECPAAKSCKKNETFAACKAECPNDYCPKNDIRGIIACDPPYPCKSGCICRANHQRLSETDDTCILASDCPPLKCKRPNEVWNRCPSNCLAERCEDINGNQTGCNRSYSYCDPKCVCKQGFYRNSNDICVPAAKCEKKCPIQPECRPTCAVPNPPNCTYIEPPDKNVDGCQCQEGYVLSNADGECIKIADCPLNQGCNGDPNAVVKQCPLPCPSTCDAPNATPCKRKCDPIGCECASGFLLSKTSGKCIRPEECKGGNPCGQNEMFVQCKSDCQYEYCPVDDSLKPITCEYPPSVPCYSGCMCRLNHKRKSRADPTCIVSSDCPPVNCTRRHEVWNPCPSACLSGYCDSVDYVDYPCNTLVLNCQPRCTCKNNYFRNASDACISADECRKNNSQGSETTPPPTQCGYNEVLSDCKITCPPQTCESIYTSYQCPNASCESGCNCRDEHLRNASGICVPSDECFTPQPCPIPSECRPTCAVPNPPNCPANKPSATNENGCQCQPGYILSDSQGECIEIEKCSSNLGCNGDPHALIKKCPWPCPSTCVAPNTVQCRKACQDVGCQCEPGYLLSKLNGKCILPDHCPGGNPCGENGIFSDCGFKCPNQYCPEDDSLVKYACKPGRPCPPGCLCKENYKWKSYEENTCVLASDCPPVNCTRPNEEWKRCPCLVEYCRDIDNSIVSSDTPDSECQAKCACIDGYYRDDNDNCVPEKECKKQTSTRK